MSQAAQARRARPTAIRRPSVTTRERHARVDELHEEPRRDALGRSLLTVEEHDGVVDVGEERRDTPPDAQSPDVCEQRFGGRP